MRSLAVVAAIACSVIGAANGQVQKAALWLKADAINAQNPEQVNNGRVKVWKDASGNNRDAVNLFADPPGYETSENARMTGLPAVRFGSGAATYLSLQQQTLFASNGKGGLAFFYVASPDADAEGIQFVFDFGSYPTKGYGAYMTRQKTGFYTPSAKAGADLSHKFDENCGVTRVVTTLIFFGSEDGTVPPKQQLFVNGVLKKEQTLCTLKPDGKTCLTTEAILLALEGTSVSYTKLPVVQTSGPPTLGRSSTGPNNAFQGLLHELIVYDRSLSQSERLAVEAYLIDKYYIAMESDVVGVCDVPAVFNFKANEVYRFYFNGRLMGVSPTNPTAGVSNLKTVSLPRVPQCGDVIGIHSEILDGATYRGIVGELVKKSVPSETIAVTDSSWLCSESNLQLDNATIEADLLKWHESGYAEGSWSRTGRYPEGSLNNAGAGRAAINADADWIWTRNATTSSGSRRSFCRMSVGPAIDAVFPAMGFFGESTQVTIYGRGFGSSSPIKEDLPVVNVPGIDICTDVTRLNERVLTCTMPAFNPAVTTRGGTTRSTSVDIVVQQTDLGNRALGTTSLLTTTWTRPAKRYLNTPGCGLEGYLASAVFTYVIKPAAA